MRRTIAGRRSVSLSALCISAAMAAGPMSAHHSTANYVSGTTVTIKGTVTQWIWSNPHCLLKFDVKAADGEVVHWVAETGAPANMVDAGWRKNSLKPGDEVTVTLRPAKNGNPLGSAVGVLFADGKTLQVGADEDTANEYHLSGAPAK